MDQKRAFVEGEADHYFRRNRSSLENLATSELSDPVLRVLDQTPLAFSTVLEIGSSNGWRLRALGERHPGIRCLGLDPSFEALSEKPAPERGFQPLRATADRLPVRDACADLLIFGFCLYLCDRSDLFRIACEADRVLAPGGHIVVFDFDVERPLRREYHHAPGLYSYKMDHAQLFLGNPQYQRTQHQFFVEPDGARLSVSLLARCPAEQAYQEEKA